MCIIAPCASAHACAVGVRGGRARCRYEAERQKAEAMAAAHSETLEIRDAFGERGLEEWPMFPGRKVHAHVGM